MKPNKPFTTMSDKILFDSRLNATDKNVYWLICQAAWGRKTFSYPSQSTIAELVGVTRQQVSKSVNKLMKYGYLKVIRRGKKITNSYDIIVFTQQEVKSFIEQRKNDMHECHSDVISELHHFKGDVIQDESDVSWKGGSDVISELQEAIQGKQYKEEEADKTKSAKTPPPAEKAAEEYKELDTLPTATSKADSTSPTASASAVCDEPIHHPPTGPRANRTHTNTSIIYTEQRLKSIENLMRVFAEDYFRHKHSAYIPGRNDIEYANALIEYCIEMADQLERRPVELLEAMVTFAFTGKEYPATPFQETPCLDKLNHHKEAMLQKCYTKSQPDTIQQLSDTKYRELEELNKKELPYKLAWEEKELQKKEKRV